jgi:hypothetical protein
MPSDFNKARRRRRSLVESVQLTMKRNRELGNVREENLAKLGQVGILGGEVAMPIQGGALSILVIVDAKISIREHMASVIIRPDLTDKGLLDRSAGTLDLTIAPYERNLFEIRGMDDSCAHDSGWERRILSASFCRSISDIAFDQFQDYPQDFGANGLVYHQYLRDPRSNPPGTPA